MVFELLSCDWFFNHLKGVIIGNSSLTYIVHELCQAIGFLHSLKRIHRDIKGKFIQVRDLAHSHS